MCTPELYGRLIFDTRQNENKKRTYVAYFCDYIHTTPCFRLPYALQVQKNISWFAKNKSVSPPPSIREAHIKFFKFNDLTDTKRFTLWGGGGSYKA